MGTESDVCEIKKNARTHTKCTSKTTKPDQTPRNNKKKGKKPTK